MCTDPKCESASDIIIRAIQESADPEKTAEIAISAICSFLSLRGRKPQALSDLHPEQVLSVAG
jgi:hypothetical protein